MSAADLVMFFGVFDFWSSRVGGGGVNMRQPLAGYVPLSESTARFFNVIVL